jgi:hypothetical protein
MMISLITTLFSSKISLFAADNIGNSCKGGEFFGLKSWFYYLPKTDFDGCNIKNFHFLPGGGTADFALVLLAVVDDLLMIAGIVAVAFVLIGAFKYVASQGNPEQTAQAQSTIINALLGTAIAITAAIFVNFLGQRLGGG